MKRSVLLLIVLTCCSFAACSGGNEPSIAQLETALVQSLPGNVAVDSLSLDEIQHFGNDGALEYGARFRATVRTLGDLYEKDSMENGVLFVRLKTPTGSTAEVVGRIRSRRYQGSWQHNVGIDGDPVADLGTPLNRFFEGRVIVRGTDEEKTFYAEAENKQAAPREPIAGAARMLVGTWRDENSRCKYNSDGSFWEAGDNGIESKGRWRVQGDILQVEIETQKQKDADDWYPSDAQATYKIIAVDSEGYTIFNDETGNTYHGKAVR